LDILRGTGGRGVHGGKICFKNCVSQLKNNFLTFSYQVDFLKFYPFQIPNAHSSLILTNEFDSKN
jgi:hypothetical protein